MQITFYSHKELNFVELNITGNNDTYVKIDAESLYLDSLVFNLFTECFEKSNTLYEYFGPTKYNARHIVPLRHRLMENLIRLQAQESLDQFRKLILGKVMGKDFIQELTQNDRNWIMRWKMYLEKLEFINQGLLDQVDRCIDEDRILWVIGY